MGYVQPHPKIKHQGSEFISSLVNPDQINNQIPMSDALMEDKIVSNNCRSVICTMNLHRSSIIHAKTWSKEWLLSIQACETALDHTLLSPSKYKVRTARNYNARSLHTSFEVLFEGSRWTTEYYNGKENPYRIKMSH